MASRYCHINVKNLQSCCDCHITVKVIPRVFDQEIIPMSLNFFQLWIKVNTGRFSKTIRKKLPIEGNQKLQELAELKSVQDSSYKKMIFEY
jgi:hypothetical protein